MMRRRSVEQGLPWLERTATTSLRTPPASTTGVIMAGGLYIGTGRDGEFLWWFYVGVAPRWNAGRFSVSLGCLLAGARRAPT